MEEAPRSIKATEFAHHDPEIFTLGVSLAVMPACGTVIALVVPVRLPPILLPAVPVILSALPALGLGDFHRRA